MNTNKKNGQNSVATSAEVMVVYGELIQGKGCADNNSMICSHQTIEDAERNYANTKAIWEQIEDATFTEEVTDYSKILHLTDSIGDFLYTRTFEVYNKEA